MVYYLNLIQPEKDKKNNLILKLIKIFFEHKHLHPKKNHIFNIHISAVEKDKDLKIKKIIKKKKKKEN